MPPDNALVQHEALALIHQLHKITTALRERYLPTVPAYWADQMQCHLTEAQAQIEQMREAVREHHLPFDSIG